MKNSTISVNAALLLLIVSSLFSSSCNTMTKTQKGAVIGAASGGTIGALIGKRAGNTALGAIVGGAIGGTAGAFIGRKMDRQAAELKNTLPGAEVIREGEGIIVKFDSGILFDTGKSSLKSEAKKNIESLVASLKSNPGTNVMVVGHTDNVGSDQYNLSLSEQRASSVKNYISNLGINSSRVTTRGMGEAEPIADNTTEVGKASNRRVEVVIVANEALKAEAGKQ
ncbi:OmpA family protein [Desertivirga brevis]|uniref:OmpA family protein n=1 Tax=Desertivirga brevis TaxID=2810310 RepID=UPI001A95889B|nr:OmpA family protein [Pedobacter sp. SYSU D00873]